MARKTGICWLAGLACGLWAQTPVAPTAYTVTEVNSMMGDGAAMQIYRDGSKALVDSVTPKSHTRQLFDLTANTTLSWDINNPAAGCATGTFSGDWGDPFVMADMEDLFKAAPKQPGGTINGIATVVSEAVEPASKMKVKLWREPKTGLIVRADITMPGADKPSTAVEVKQFSAAQPAAAIFTPPAGCMKNGAPVKPPTEEDKFAALVGGAGADYADGTRGPGSPNSCSMLLRFVDGKMQPLTNFQVALDTQYDIGQPPHYVMGGSASGRTVFSGGHLKEFTGEVRNGVLRVDNVPDHFDMEVTFAGGNKGASSGLIYRHCSAPQTVLLFAVKDPANVSAGTSWMWVKSGKYAVAPNGAGR